MSMDRLLLWEFTLLKHDPSQATYHTGIQGAEVVGREHLRSRDLGTSAINGRGDGGEGGSARGEGNQSEGGQLHDRR